MGGAVYKDGVWAVGQAGACLAKFGVENPSVSWRKMAILLPRSPSSQRTLGAGSLPRPPGFALRASKPAAVILII